SWYYAVAGVALVASGLLMMFHDMAGLWVYLAAWVFTLAWAWWEAGMDVWAQVPRLVAPTVLLLLALSAIPGLRRPQIERRYPPGAALGILVLLGLGGALLLRDVAPPALANGGETRESVEPATDAG